MKKTLLLTIFILTALSLHPHNALATRLHTTGFETQSVTDENLTTSGLSNALQISTSVKRSGAASVTLGSSITASTPNGSRYIYPAATASTTLRFYLFISAYPDVDTSIAAITNATPYTTNRARIKLTTTGKLQLVDGGGNQIGSNTAVMALNTWVRVELKHYNVNSTTGTVEAKLEGRAFGSSDVASTAGTGGSFALGINLASEAATTGNWYFDDVALNNNAAATTQNDYPGAGAVVNLYPNATGDFAEGASNGSGVGWNDVDEKPSDSDTTYWQLQSNNDRLDVNVDNSSTAGILGSDVITLVQVNMIIRNDASAGSTFAARLKSTPGGTVSQSSAVTMNSASWNVNDDGSDKTGRVVATTDTETGNRWTPSVLDSLQIGIIALDADPDMFVTAMWATVEYTPPPARPPVIKLPSGRVKFTGGRIIIK